MYLPAETVTETAGLDEQLRERYSTKAFLELEQGTVLGRFHDFWASLPQGENGLPVLTDDMLKAGLPGDVLHWVSQIDTRPENPMEYVMQACSTRQLPEYCVEAADTLVIEIPCIFHAIQLAIECLACKHDRNLAYHVINQTIGGKHSHYARLLLPVGDASGNVVKIFHAVRPVHVPQYAEALG